MFDKWKFYVGVVWKPFLMFIKPSTLLFFFQHTKSRMFKPLKGTYYYFILSENVYQYLLFILLFQQMSNGNYSTNIWSQQPGPSSPNGFSAGATTSIRSSNSPSSPNWQQQVANDNFTTPASSSNDSSPIVTSGVSGANVVPGS